MDTLARILPAIVLGLTLTGCGAAPPAPDEATAATDPVAGASDTPGNDSAELDATLSGIARDYAAEVGVSAVDTGSGARIDHRADDRWGYASTFKIFLAAQFLDQTSKDERQTILTWTEAEVEAAGWAPVTSQHVEDGLSLDRLAEAAVRESDNAATNLLLDHLGGPQTLDAWLTDLGDDSTEVVNDEPGLNTIEPGSTDDTTTPRAFTANLQTMITGDILDEADREQLLEWMSGNATGDTLIRAGAPDGWEVADKSGGADAIRNDIAVVTAPGRDPIVITVLTTKTDPDAEREDALVAEVAAVVLDHFA